MKQHVEEATRWIYQGVWAVVVRWFRVPPEPPALPISPGESVTSFRPAAGFLRYLKFQFWVMLLVVDIFLTVAWLALFVAVPLAGALITPIALAVIIVPDILAYIAIHLRYDTTWYVLTDRSLRIRRGIWILHETTITFENIQNVSVSQGPLQRYFGIADVRVETAGGGGHISGKGDSSTAMGSHQGLLEGVDNAPEIRDLILRRLKAAKASGLGDELPDSDAATGLAWSPEQVNVLREIRTLVARAAGE